MMKQYIYIMVVLAVTMALALGLTSCDRDCPVCSAPPTEPVSDYDVYITGQYANTVYVYNTARKAIIDSIPLHDSLCIGSIAVSGDGRHLLIASYILFTSGSANVTVIDLISRDTILTYSNLIRSAINTEIEVSNTGKYIAVHDGNDIHFLDGNTFDVLFSDTLDIHSGRFIGNDSLFYCEWTGREYGIYDMAAESLVMKTKYVDNYGNSPWIWGIQPTHDGSALFMFVRYGAYANWFVSYRPTLDSIGVRYRMGPPGGNLRISPDGKTILVSDPGFLEAEMPGTYMLIAVDAANDGITIVSPGYTNDGSYIVLPGDIAFTPDSRYATVASETSRG
jgi:hypothetical protein